MGQPLKTTESGGTEERVMKKVRKEKVGKWKCESGESTRRFRKSH